jgi:hypothetical protein
MSNPSEDTAPKPARGLKRSGRRLWMDISARFELEREELDLLERACRTRDLLDELDGIVRREGTIVNRRAHPALVELRQQSIVFTRLIASLRIPDKEGVRAQRRGRARGAYRVAAREPLQMFR